MDDSHRGMRRRILDPVTSSPGRDLPPFEDEDDNNVVGGDRENDEDAEDEDGEELFGDNMENDYRPMPALDRYDQDLMDDEDDFDIMSEADRAAAEAAMRKRDRQDGREDALRTGRMRRGLLYGSDDRDDEDDDDGEDGEPSRRRRRLMADRAAEGIIIDQEVRLSNKIYRDIFR